LTRYLLSGLVILSGCFTLLFAGGGPTNPSDTLQHFYIVSHVVSDAGPFWYEYILDVNPTDEGALVRKIRIAPLNSYCTTPITVKAAERIISDMNPESLAGVSLCSLNEGAVASAVKTAGKRGNGSINDTVGFTIVAKCGRTNKVFDLPLEQAIDFEWLQKNEPSVAELYSLSGNISKRAFGKGFSFYDVSSDQNKAFQELGARIVPDLKRGKYDRGFARTYRLSAIVDDYIGIVEHEEATYIELSNPPDLHFAKYAAPTFPRLAEMARIQGEVRIKITIDASTGGVRDVEATSGHPLLKDAAIAAARQWQFQRESQLPESVEIGVKFELRCPTR
jgi:TonB family protein